MNILFITKSLPFPTDSGGKFVTAHILQHMMKENTIHICFFYEKKKLQYKSPYFNLTYHPIPLLQTDPALQKLLRKSLFSLYPYEYLKYKNETMKKHVQYLILTGQFNCIVIDDINLKEYVPEKWKGKKILLSQNIYTAFSLSAFIYAHNFQWKLFFMIETIKYFFLELFQNFTFDQIIVTTNHDKSVLEKILSLNPVNRLLPKVSVFPFKLKVAQRNRSKSKNFHLLFVGSLTWYPNFQGLLWFLEKIFPLSLKEFPELTLTVVGEIPEYFPFQKYQSHVIYFGLIKKEKELHKIYKHSAICIVPIFIGSGIRTKFIEALKYGIQIITTDKGKEGISVSNNPNVHIANTQEEFKKEIHTILENKRNKQFKEIII